MPPTGKSTSSKGLLDAPSIIVAEDEAFVVVQDEAIVVVEDEAIVVVEDEAIVVVEEQAPAPPKKTRKGSSL